ncbi:negative regulator for alginate biosynthesis MucB [Halomonas daqingensis]|uniref:Negative regulator for alginate biosynthesis MucB n=1 Tax=Billgrantia desiderata TaxID=52021 RepID=A0ABS9B707_9GAMM|nr:negative regulator for alginate biosynthesis MucB [Halomonas desiderata]MCE8043281.1 negative regulator for alginate biosynthesis MucB [Halomonas desiderata]MCE8047856.1 negative regulator for alginate biosynthesis MucB [Halomonas desiderata]OUE41118.1 negative regulator for alginate biosynthesis MucB [Halomonas desiderata SP1]
MVSRRDARCLAALSGALLLAYGAAAIAQTSNEPTDTERFDCQQLAEWERPDSPLEWFERSLWAGHCHVFQARAVRIGIDGVRTLALSRDIQDGIEREVARFLDGPPVFFERRGHIGRMSWSNGEPEVPASPAGMARHIEQYYRLSMGSDERIANRSAVRLDIEPLDGLRFGHRLWLDEHTALPLKRELIDDRGRVVETFQLTELQPPQLYQGGVVLDTSRTPPQQAWRAGWLPNGFLDQPVDTQTDQHDPEVGHRIYSDGLSTLSLFVEPIEEGRERLIPGLHRLGISLAVVRHVVADGRPMQVVAMGELPPRVLAQVAESLTWREASETAE